MMGEKFNFAYAAAVVSRVLARTDRKLSHALALESLRAAEQVAGPRARAMALRMTALALSRTDVKKAIEVARSIDLRAHEANVFWQARAFQSIASVLAKTNIDQALEVARMIKDRYSRVDALLTVAAAAKKKASSRWAGILNEAEKAAQGIEHGYTRMEALSAIRRAAGRKGAEARRIARASAEDIARIHDPRERDHARLGWAGSLAQTDPDAALKVARGVEDPYLRVVSIAEIARVTLEGRPSARQQ
jgi:hypothetical protein